MPDGWVLSGEPHSRQAGEGMDHEHAFLMATQVDAFQKLPLKD